MILYMEDLYCWQKKNQTCYYSNRLINKIILLNQNNNNKVQLTTIKKAIYYAKKYHGDQKRQTGEPYYSHPLEVAYMIADYLFKTDILVTSILHDTIEDTTLTKDMIACIFNPVIANNIVDLTRIMEDHKINISENIKDLYFKGKSDLLLVKIFDRLHNLETLYIKPCEKIKNIAYETLQEFIILSMHLGNIIPNMLQIEEKITQMCYHKYKHYG